MSEPRGAPPEGRVRAMFDDVVDRYDLVNDVLSFGLDRWWRRAVARAVSAATPRGPVLDLGCGAGELGAVLGERAVVAGVDLSHRMLLAARRRSPAGLFVEGSAFHLPFGDGSFGAAVSAFVLRNLDDLPAAFAEVARVVVAGAPMAFVDITEPPGALMRWAFDAYFGVVAPRVGRLVGKEEAYRYLVSSVAHLPDRSKLCALLDDAGFERSAARPLTGGMVTLFTATRS